MIRNILFSAFIFMSFSTVAADKTKPHWTLELNGGVFQPEDDNWSTYYGKDYMWAIGGSMAYRIFNVLDFGVNLDYSQDRGVGNLPISGLTGGKVTYRVLPVDFFALFRLRFAEGQWIVPYGGGGYTRYAYHITVAGEGSTRGSVNGYHARAGLQFLLDVLDPSAAKEMFRNYGAVNSYLYFELKRTRVEAGTPAIQIGGYSAKSGIMIEFN